MAARYIKRVQTVVSFSQLDLEEDGMQVTQPSFGPTSPVADCPGHALPLHAFAPSPAPAMRYRRLKSRDSVGFVPDFEDDRSSRLDRSASVSSDSDFDTSADEDAYAVVPMAVDDSAPPSPTAVADRDGSLLDTVLTALWDDCAANGLFRYDISTCSTKVVPGRFDFVAQLNEGRATKKRPTEFRVDQVCQPFDEGKFNFKKAYAREVLFQFEPSAARTGGKSAADAGGSQLVESAPCSTSPNLVVINVSPIEYGHVLLVPRVLDNVPQLVDPSTVELALHFAKESDNPNFRVGYNSLGAYATINHLHFQGYYLDAAFPCELAATVPLWASSKRRRGGVSISRLANYPVNGFVVELADGQAELAEGLSALADVVGQACIKMQQRNIPHNLLISNRGRKVFVFPQCFAERQAQGLVPEVLQETGVNPAAFETAGHILLKRQVDYDSMSEIDICALLQQASLPEDRFMQVAELCFSPKVVVKAA